MKIAVFHGSPRRGNTYRATEIFMDRLRGKKDVRLTEFFLPGAVPVFCTGCQLCLGNPRESCPHAGYIDPVYSAIMQADALIFTTPHYGGCAMSGCMKNLLDHLDFFTLNVAPREEMFGKKAFIITTGSGSAASIKPIAKYLKNWGINRVHSLGIRMFTNAWDSMPAQKKIRCEKSLRRAAERFYAAEKKRPYAQTVFMYHLSKFILKKYVGEQAYSYKYWAERGYFKKRPF